MRSPVAVPRLPWLFVAFFWGLSLAGWGQTLELLQPSARNQITALQAEKATRSPARRKMDSRLVQIVRKQRGEAFGAGLDKFAARVQPAADGRELVDIRGTVNDALLAHLRGIGAEIVASVPRFNAIRARVSWKELETLAGRADVQFVKPAAKAMTNVGSVTSEGDQTHQAATVRANFKATGRGMKIGVLSDSVDYLPLVQSSGDLGKVTVLPGQDGTTLGDNGAGLAGEGTAMLEIVHDLAPDAELFFGTAFLSEAQFAQNILDLRKVGCDIIVDDVGYFDESPFMDGPLAQAVDAVVADGALYFSSAGNEGNRNDGSSGTWEGDFVDGGPAAAPLNANGRVHSFGATAYNTINSAGLGITLFWADPYGASDNDYDLYLVDATGSTVLASSTNVQTGSQDPFEFIEGSVTGARVVVVKAANAQPRYLQIKNLRGTLAVSTAGACNGHAAATGALAVAAVNAATSSPNPFSGGIVNPVETFSTDGLRRVFYYPDGTPITPGNFTATGGTVRQKPDIAAADGVVTATPGFNPFFGTSAAAPHASAIAALVWSYNRHLTPAQVRTALISTALDIEAPGIDRDSGAGIVMPNRAIPTVAPGAIVQLGSATITAESFAPANDRPDPGETITIALALTNVGAAAGNITATLVPTGGVSSPSVPQNYGSLAAGGGQATRNFTFTANGAPGGALKVTFTLSSAGVSLGTIEVPFVFGSAGTAVAFTNTNAITLNDDAAANPYPSQINVSGVAGTIGKVTVQLTGLTHTYPGDLSFLLVSPTGTAVQIMNGAGGGNPVTNVNLTLDDDAGVTLSSSTLSSGTFRPAQYDSMRDPFPSPAPGGVYAGALSAFDGELPNGVWSLFAIDSYTGDAGVINGGWKLTITPASAATNGVGPDLNVVITPPASPLSVGDIATIGVQVFNNGAVAANNVSLFGRLPDAFMPSGGSITQGSGSISGQDLNITFGTVPAGASASVALFCNVKGSGSAVLSFFASLSGADNNASNNSSSASVFVGQANLAPAGSLVISTAPGTGTPAPVITPTDPLYLNFAVTNSGSGPANQAFRTQVLLDGVVVRTLDRPLPLAAGQSEPTLDLPLGLLAPGAHTVAVRFDATSTVPETSESDNELTSTFAVEGPNLAPFTPAGASGSLVVSKTTGTGTDTQIFQSSDSIYFDVALTNNGQLATGVASRLRFFLNGSEFTVADPTVPANLAPGATLLLSDLPLGSRPPGLYTLRVVLDADGEIAETNEADNEVAKIFLVNAAPTISTPANFGTNEDTPSAVISFNVSDAETSADTLSVSASVESGQVVLGGSGSARTLQYTPAQDFFGVVHLQLRVADDAGGSASTSEITVTVNPVNDPPSFLAGANQTIAEDAGPVVVPFWVRAVDRGAPNESAQQITFTVTADHPEYFSVAPAIGLAGDLTFTPAPNANGTAQVTVGIEDDGGADRGGNPVGASVGFTITIVPVNDPPTFSLGGEVDVAQDDGPQTRVGFAGAISAGPADEAAQTVSFNVVAGRPDLFTVGPAISADGTLVFTPNPSASGRSTVFVTATDSAGGVSATQTFTIAVMSFVEETGSYQALVQPSAAAGSTVEQVGFLKLTASAKGRVTGSVQVARRRYAFKGTVGNDGQVLFGRRNPETSLELPRRRQSGLAMTLNMNVAGGPGDQLTGTIQDGATPFAVITGSLVPFGRKNRLPEGVAGTYTVLFPHRTGNNNGVDASPEGAGVRHGDHGASGSVDPVNYPGGDGIATLTVKSNGTVRLRGTLADGKKVSASAALSAALRWPLFARTDRGQGALSGFIDFAEDPGVSDAAGTGLLWYKPASAREPRFPAGWPGGIFIDFLGSKFARTAGQSILPGLGLLDADGNAEFEAEGGGIPGTLVQTLAIDSRNRVQIVDTNNSALRLVLHARTGLLSGRFTSPVGQVVKVFGAVFQRQARVGGFFIGGATAGSIGVIPDDIPGSP